MRCPSISVRHAAPPSTGKAKGFPATSPSRSAISPTRIFPRPASRCGRSRATRGFPCRPRRRPSAWRSRGERSASICFVRAFGGLVAVGRVGARHRRERQWRGGGGGRRGRRKLTRGHEAAAGGAGGGGKKKK